MEFNLNNIFKQITDSLYHYYGLHVTVKTANGSNLFPEHRAVTSNGSTTYTIRFNHKVITILSLYNRAMSNGEDIGETVNLYTLFHAFLELNDYTDAKRQLNAFRRELERLNLTHRTPEMQEEADAQILLQIYYLLLHEAFHTIFNHSPALKAIAIDTTRELLLDLKNEMVDQLSHISNKELLSHPKIQKRLSALIPYSLSQHEREEMEKQLRKELEAHPYSTEYIDSLLNGEDKILLQEIACDRQAWLNLLSMFQNDDVLSPEDVLQLHRAIFVAFCAMNFNFNLQSQYRPACRSKYEYNGNRVVFRHRAFKTLLRHYNPDAYQLVTTQYLDLYQGLETIFRTSILSIFKYQNDFALLYQMHQEQSNKTDYDLYMQIENEMIKVADKL